MPGCPGQGIGVGVGVGIGSGVGVGVGTAVGTGVSVGVGSTFFAHFAEGGCFLLFFTHFFGADATDEGTGVGVTVDDADVESSPATIAEEVLGSSACFPADEATLNINAITLTIKKTLRPIRFMRPCMSFLLYGNVEIC